MKNISYFPNIYRDRNRRVKDLYKMNVHVIFFSFQDLSRVYRVGNFLLNFALCILPRVKK